MTGGLASCSLTDVVAVLQLVLAYAVSSGDRVLPKYSFLAERHRKGPLGIEAYLQSYGYLGKVCCALRNSKRL